MTGWAVSWENVVQSATDTHYRSQAPQSKPITERKFYKRHVSFGDHNAVGKGMIRGLREYPELEDENGRAELRFEEVRIPTLPVTELLPCRTIKVPMPASCCLFSPSDFSMGLNSAQRPLAHPVTMSFGNPDLHSTTYDRVCTRNACLHSSQVL